MLLAHQPAPTRSTPYASTSSSRPRSCCRARTSASGVHPPLPERLSRRDDRGADPKMAPGRGPGGCRCADHDHPHP